MLVLPALVLGATAAALFVAEPFGIARHARVGVASGSFELCGRAHRSNCVIDGDTIRYDGEVIRIAGIDAPETHAPKCEAERSLGRRATERLRQLLNAGPFDVVHQGGRDTDKYGRKLRVLERHGRSLGEILIAEGLAHRWDGAKRSWCG